MMKQMKPQKKKKTLNPETRSAHGTEISKKKTPAKNGEVKRRKKKEKPKISCSNEERHTRRRGRRTEEAVATHPTPTSQIRRGGEFRPPARPHSGGHPPPLSPQPPPDPARTHPSLPSHPTHTATGSRGLPAARRVTQRLPRKPIKQPPQVLLGRCCVVVVVVVALGMAASEKVELERES